MDTPQLPDTIKRFQFALECDRPGFPGQCVTRIKLPPLSLRLPPETPADRLVVDFLVPAAPDAPFYFLRWTESPTPAQGRLIFLSGGGVPVAVFVINGMRPVNVQFAELEVNVDELNGGPRPMLQTVSFRIDGIALPPPPLPAPG